MSYFKAFGLAFNMLTIFPIFKIHTYEEGINGKSTLFYPLIGLFLGFLLFLLYALLTPYIPQTHLAVIIFALSILFTGALHLDGLSDTIDGLFVSKAKALAVMKDSHVGGMGMIFTFVFLALKLSTLVHLQVWALLPVVMMLSRLNATLAIYLYPYISSGVGSLLKQELKLSLVIVTLLYSSFITFFFNGTILLIAALISMLLLGTFFYKRYQGLNGDIYGFIIEITELILLNCLIIL